MSIQSEINRISSEVTTQTDLLGQIAAELAGKAAGGDIEIQTDKEAVTPSNVAQTVWPDSGYDALAKVTVKAIPSPYFDTSEVTAGEDDVVTGKKIVSASGETIAGTNPYEKAATDTEVGMQSDLIAQIAAALEGKAAGGSGGDTGLPAGYKRVDYIRFTGKQTVDTGIICNQDTKLKMVFTRENSSQHYMFGVASSDNTASVTAYLGGSWRFGNKSSTKSPATNADMIYSGILNDAEITITDAKATISGVNDFETIGTMLLGACRSASGAVAASQFEGKIFAWLMWSGDELVQKLVPVVSTDGVYRFFDTVTQTFFDSITDTPLEGGNL